jgi:hypothetical protein
LKAAMLPRAKQKCQGICKKHPREFCYVVSTVLRRGSIMTLKLAFCVGCGVLEVEDDRSITQADGISQRLLSRCTRL